MIGDVDYKILSFSRADGLFAIMKILLDDPFDANENFLVLTKEEIDTVEEIQLFGWIQNQRYTMNEFNFFAMNNDLCLRVKDKDGLDLSSYGICATTSDRIFGLTFGTTFN